MSEMSEAETALTVIRPGALGDTLLALPALAWLRAHARLPVRLTLIARADVLPLAAASGLAETVWPWDLPDWAALYDPTMTPERLTSRARAALTEADALIAWLPDADGALATTLHRLNPSGRVHVAPPRPNDAAGAPVEHVALWLARSLAPLGLTPPSTTLDLAALTRAPGPLRWPEADGRAAEAVWRALALPGADAAPRRVVALHPGAGGAAKRWAPERFAALAGLARAAGRTPLLISGPADAEAAEGVQAALTATGAAPLPHARDLALGTLAALLARCAGYAGNDSGVSHLAGLLGVSTLAIFGPTDPARWSPLGPRVTALQAPGGDLARLAPETAWAALLAAMG